MYGMDNVQNKKRYFGDNFFYMGTDLKLIFLLTIATILSIIVPVLNETLVRLAFSAAMLIFIPGYAFTAALYPKNSDLSFGGRVALSFGMSITLCPIIELVLSYTPWGLSLVPLVVCLIAFTIACVMAASVRRHKLHEEDRFSLGLRKACGSIKAAILSDKSGYDRALTVILIVSFLLASFTVACVVIMPRPTEKFTEFYVLGPNNTADSYPVEFSYGDLANYTVGIVNHELRNVNYDLTVLLDDNDSIYPLYRENKISIADNQSWKKPVSLALMNYGTGMKLEFLLYVEGNRDNPYRECHFWINVSGTK